MPQFRSPATLENLSCQVLLSVLYNLTVNHDHDISQSTARRQFLLVSVLPAVKQKLVSIITSTLNQDLNITCKLLDYTLDTSITQLDLCTRKFSFFTFPVEQVQTVYRLLSRGEPTALERLCMGIDTRSDEKEEEEDREEKEIINWYTGAVKRKEENVSKVLVYNSYFYPTLERLKKLRHVVLHGVCDNQTLSIMGQNCNVLQYLDFSGSADVTDVGIQNLVFPPAIQKAGRVNLVNTRARTNPSAKQLHTVMAHGTGVDVTGCIILLQFCPRLTKGGGRLEHNYIGEAIYILNKKLKVSNITIKELIDADIDESKEAVFSQIISKLETIRTEGKSLPRVHSLCSPQNCISELYLDFSHQDYRQDLTAFLAVYPGANLKVLEVRNMDEPMDIEMMSEECPGLECLRMMMNGVWENCHKTTSHFPKLTRVHLKTASPETLQSFMRFNTSVKEMSVSCPNEGKSKFSDAFIQTICRVKGFLPELKNINFCSKFQFGFTSAQKLIESLISLEYIGQMEMFTKMSKADITDLVTWVKENNWNVVIGHRHFEYNVFNLDQSDPWKHKFVPDKGRIPVKAPAPDNLSIPYIQTDEEEDISRANSMFTQCSARKSGSMLSVKRSNGSNRTSVNLDNESFEFEFAMDSDGFLKNKDYKMQNVDPMLLENDEDYEYDEFDEDTMDVEDLPDDAEFEWCWGEDGNLKIYEIDKNGKDDSDDQSIESIIKEDETLPTELKVANNSAEDELSKEKYRDNDSAVESVSSKDMNGNDTEIVNTNSSLCENFAASQTISSSAAKSGSRSKSQTEIPKSSSSDQENTNSSRRAKKRTAQVTPPPTNDELCSQYPTRNMSAEQATRNGQNGVQGTSAIPTKASRPSSETGKTVKIASLFERQNQNSPQKLTSKPDIAKSSTDQNFERSKGLVSNKPQKTHVIEVFEYDPMLGYCTVKRKTVPIEETEDSTKSPSSVNLSFLLSSKSTDIPNEESEKSDQQTTESDIVKNSLFSYSASFSPQTISSNSSSKENRTPQEKRRNASEPLIPFSSISKYDIPFIGPLLAAKSIAIPEPPKCKPPSLPDTTGSALPLPKLRRSLSHLEDEAANTKAEPKTPSTESNELEATEISQLSVPGTSYNAQETLSENPPEAQDWYWDYEDKCWKECDPGEEYEWEYIDSDEEKELEEVVRKHSLTKSEQLLAKKEQAMAGKPGIPAQTTKDSASDMPSLQQEARREPRLTGSRELLDIPEDDDDMSPLHSNSANCDKDLEKDRKLASKLSKGKKRSGKLTRQASVEDELSESASSREDLLDIPTTRRRRKGVVEKAGHDDEPTANVAEVSKRARRRRKETVTDERHSESKIEEFVEKKEAHGDEIYAKESNEVPIKRRNTNKKIDAEKAKHSATRSDAPITSKAEFDDELDEETKPPAEQAEGLMAQKEFMEEKGNESDEINVSFCMWGHENCRTRSHYRYNWQWDYVQKYVDQHNKNVIQGYKPKESSNKNESSDPSQELKETIKKPGKDGIKIRLQMLQNRLAQGKTSGAMKQKIFERDLELEMLRRKKNYKF